MVDPGASPISRGLTALVKAVLAIYVEIFRGTPMMVQATVVYYGTMSLWGLDIPSFSARCIGAVPEYRRIHVRIRPRRHRRH